MARDSLKKYVVIHDDTGSKSSGAASFFSYRGRLFELHKELISVRVMNSQSYDAVAEKLRFTIVNAMRAGNILCIDCGKIKANLKDDLASVPWA